MPEVIEPEVREVIRTEIPDFTQYGRELLEDPRWAEKRRWTVEGPGGGLLMCYPAAVLQTWSDDQWRAWEEVARASDPDYVPLMDSGEDVGMEPADAFKEPEMPRQEEREPLPDVSGMTHSEQWVAFLTPNVPSKDIAESWAEWSEQAGEWDQWNAEQPEANEHSWEAQWNAEQPEANEHSWEEQWNAEQPEAHEHSDGQPLEDPALPENAKSKSESKSPPPSKNVKWAPLTPEGVARFSGTLDAVKFKAEQVAKFRDELLSMTLEGVIDWVAWKGGQPIEGCPEFIVRTFTEILNLRDSWEVKKCEDFAYWLAEASGAQVLYRQCGFFRFISRDTFL